jgi:hypothetical protein
LVPVYDFVRMAEPLSPREAGAVSAGAHAQRSDPVDPMVHRPGRPGVGATCGFVPSIDLVFDFDF